MAKAKNKLPLIFVTNDDGINAKGLAALIEIVQPFGKIVVVAPEKPESGMSNAITTTTPVRVSLLSKNDKIKVYSCEGTPVDCIKLGLHELLKKKPDYIVSGINHGSNASISIVYSGTMGAVIEGCINRIPSIGFSLTDFSKDANFDAAIHFGKIIFQKFLLNNIPEDTCVNVNIPKGSIKSIKGIKICRQAKGAWKEEFDKRLDPHNKVYYWLTGDFHNFEPDATDTDEWALRHNFVSIVPISIDLTSHSTLEHLKNCNYESIN